MAVKSSPNRPAARQPRPSQAPRTTNPRPPRNNDRFAHDIWGLSLVALGLILLVSLILQHRGHAGLLGDALVQGLRLVVGIGAWVFPVLLTAIGVMLIQGRHQHTRANFAGGAALLFLVSISWWHLGHTTHITEFTDITEGGWIGAAISSGLRTLVGDISSHIFLFLFSVGAVVWATDMRLLHLFDHAVEGGRRVSAPITQGARASAQAVKSGAQSARQGADALKEKVQTRRDYTPEMPPPVKAERAEVLVKAEAAPAVAAVTRKTPLSVAGNAIESDDLPTVPRVTLTPKPPAIPLLPMVQLEKPKAPEGPLVIPEALGNDGTKHEYVLPPLELLNESPPKPVQHESAIREKQAVLMQTLNDFKIGANVAQVAMGPTVTRYEVQLEPGILVRKIVALADNLAMSLAAIDVRVEAPIPGKAAIGIEVPNDVTQMVSLRECLSTNEFMNAPSKLTFALGKDVSGEYKYADLTRMPHLLVGGSTNSGKSVCLNVIISSIIYRATPREVKFVMIDPKRVELSLYDGIPHLLAPVIKDVKQAAGIFRSVLKEMEERYDRFARIGTRNIDGFNSRVPPDERLPFIVVVVDELADLMMQQGPEVETSICRIAQLARATGIHLVIATQRPSVDVITGTIKANISSRIAFAVATQVDSRTIIDMPGADRLIGRGDMLFMPIDAAKPIRVQGCYVGERETEELVKYLRNQEEAVYTMIPSESSSGGYGADGEDDGTSDELFEPCVRWLVMQGQCSTSSLQRKFKIGYTRAARLVETMEARQIVGSQDGVKPREILLRSENLEAFFSGHQDGDLGQ
ncbi:MAG: DNA translocase FtsK 4TM domain-containing protein [Janthinobacterium lividum]